MPSMPHLEFAPSRGETLSDERLREVFSAEQDNTRYVDLQLRRVVIAVGGALPAKGAFDGQQAELHLGGGVRWTLAYNAVADGAGDAPWEWVGGSELEDYVAAQQTRGGPAGNLGTVGPQLVAPWRGDYWATWACQMLSQDAVADVAWMFIDHGVALGGENQIVGANDGGSVGGMPPVAATQGGHHSRSRRFNDIAAGYNVIAKYQTVNTKMLFAERTLALRPIRLRGTA